MFPQRIELQYKLAKDNHCAVSEKRKLINFYYLKFSQDYRW